MLMDMQELEQRLMAAFLEELQEHVIAFNRNLLELEKHPLPEQQQALIKELFRAAHTLKGAANANGLGMVEQFCHRLEDILVAVRDGQRAFTDDLFAICFRAADALDEVGSLLRNKTNLENSQLVKLSPLLQQAAVGESNSLADASSFSKHARTSTPTTFDITSTDSQQEAPFAIPHAVTAAQTSAPVVNKPTTAPVAPFHPAASEPGATSVRIAADKLDQLLEQSSEIFVALQRVHSRVAELQELREWIGDWSTNYRIITKPINLLSKASRKGYSASSEAPSVLMSRLASILGPTSDRIKQLEQRCEHLASTLTKDVRLLTQSYDALDDEVHRSRMLPFAEACVGLERVTRDLARVTNKQIKLVIEGAEVEFDRSMLEELKGPLLHIIRNAVDHGIELPQDRMPLGKTAMATITVSAVIRGSMVEVTVHDDGQGFDIKRIQEIAHQRGWIVPQEERELVRLIFQPGFSTSSTVTDISGRGIGLDVVQSKIESLHGTVDVDSTPGRGTRFTLQVPLTLTTIRGVLVRAGDHTYVIPTNSVRKIVRFEATRVVSVSGRGCLRNGESPIPISYLEQIVHPHATLAVKDGYQMGIELNSAATNILFVVDEVLGEQEIVVSSLGHRIRRVRHVSGATMLPTGRVALLLNVANLLRSAVGQNTAIANLKYDDIKSVKLRRLLVVEDSLTTRTLMKSILETAGYEVLTATDGQHAWELLNQKSFELVVSDVDMPRMNGFELTASIRGARQFANLPVILVTARHSDEDKARGVDVGANGYLLKSAFDQRMLLETIRQLL